MAELKTKPNKASVRSFLAGIEDDQRKKDCKEIAQLMAKITGSKAKMWGGSIVGYGSYHYKYASGKEGDWFLTGFSPRKQALTLYVMSGFSEYDKLMAKLGKYKTGRSCLYIKRLSDVDSKVLGELIKESVAYIEQKYNSK